MDDPKQVKILAFKESALPSRRHTKTGTGVILKAKVKEVVIGYNTGNEVRDAQRTLVACGLDAGLVTIEVDEDGTEEVVVDELMSDLLEMITPNTSYVTGPPSMGSMKQQIVPGLSQARAPESSINWHPRDGYTK